MSRKFALIFVLSVFIVTKLYTQPLLPDIAGALEKGIIILTWECQYDGVKSISVLRSSDSVHNYSTVGYVKDVKKGMQAFVDGHPGAGKNWYQLYIVFNSGLTWNSNRMKIYVDTATLLNQQLVLPPNDSLQKLFKTTLATDKPVKSKSGMVVSMDTGSKKGSDANTIDISGITGVTDIFKLVTKKDSGTIFYSLATGVRVTTIPMNKVGIPDVAKSTEPVVKPKPITLSLNSDPNINPYTFIKSRYIFTNPLTGHINMELPAVSSHHYSVKFFDDHNNVVVEIPKIMASPLIIDKRNFQNKGIYKFELRRDNSQFETGYVTIY